MIDMAIDYKGKTCEDIESDENVKLYSTLSERLIHCVLMFRFA